MNLMLPDSGLIFWMTIIFAIVFFILAKFGFPVITGMVEKRAKRIDDAISAARKAEDAIAHLNQEKERIISETRAEQNLLKTEAVQERDRMIAEAQNQARLEAQKIIEDARQKIGEERDAALRDVRREVALLSLAIAEKIVRENLSSDEKQKALADRMASEASDLYDVNKS
jgi:F-type H+-transporting ATPase subunit b